MARAWAAGLAVVLIAASGGRGAEALRVRVGLGDERGEATGRASGLLLSLTVDRPAEDRVAPLRFRCFRGRLNERQLLGAGYYERLRRLGVEHVQAVTVGYRGLPGEGGDWSPWEALMRGCVRRAKARGMRLEWDVWNEPNGPHFWPGDRARFFEAWARAVRAIRQEDPRAVVVGPSISRFDMGFLEPFLRYARAERVLPDVLSWHELRDGTSIPEHVGTIRRFLADNDMAVGRISINEIIPRARQFSPGVAVVYFASLEAAGVESACHSCWPEGPDRWSTNCERPMLDGLVGIDGEPRAAWWAYKAYADLTGQLLGVSCEGEGDGTKSVAAMAGKDGKEGAVRVLIGNGSAERAYPIRIDLEGVDEAPWAAGSRVRVVVERIPSLGNNPLKRPEKVLDRWQRVDGEVLSLDLPELGADEVFVLRVGK